MASNQRSRHTAEEVKAEEIETNTLGEYDFDTHFPILSKEMNEFGQKFSFEELKSMNPDDAYDEFYNVHMK